MISKSDDFICIACSIFKRELTALKNRGDIDFPIRYLNSNLHMCPSMLGQQLDAVVRKELGEGKKILLMYGECHSYMNRYDSMPDVCRLPYSNCPEILLGTKKYFSLLKEGAFFLLLEWTMDWERVFKTELGLNKDIAKEFMMDMHTKLVYLDTGLVRVPEEQLENISEYTGLPCEVMPISLSNLYEAIRKTLDGIQDDS